MKYYFNKDEADRNYKELKKDGRYRKVLGVVANLVAHEWNLSKVNNKYYLHDNTTVYDPLLTVEGYFWKECKVSDPESILAEIEKKL